MTIDKTRQEPYCINLYLSNGKERSFQDRIYETEMIAPAVTSTFRPYFLTGIKQMNKENEEPEYRIRKLTPKECWRLMGFTDADYDNAKSVNSDTQLYKQAGNSIVVPVLEGLFKSLLE